MTKEIIVDLYGVKNENDVIYRLRKALCLFTHVSEEEYQSRAIKNDHPSSWDALNDDMSVLSFEEINNRENSEIHLTILGFDDIAKNISQKSATTLFDVLTNQSDSTQRIDKYKFSFEIT